MKMRRCFSIEIFITKRNHAKNMNIHKFNEDQKHKPGEFRIGIKRKMKTKKKISKDAHKRRL